MKKIFQIALIILIPAMTIGGWQAYRMVESPNVVLNGKSTFLYIRTGSTFDSVLITLRQQDILKNEKTFEWLAGMMKYRQRIKPGRYKIENGMSNRELISLLRSGRQTPVRLTFISQRTVYDVIREIAKQTEPDSQMLANEIFNPELLDSLQLDSLTAGILFIPNTYELYWNTPASEVIKRMIKEYNRFWNEERRAGAKRQNLSLKEVSILASIVEQETRRNDEKQQIAGVYLNRLRKGWKLEADPTLVFAAGNFDIKRVLNVHKETDSPFNTYKYHGLPPGPICIPSISSIDAVLNAAEHEYMYFCAREDMSGYHAFATTYAEHLINARKFQKELNRRGIRN